MRAAESLATESKPAPGDLRFVQAFVNTLDVESGRDAFGDPEGVAAWLKRHGALAPSARVGEAERRSVVAFREALRTLLTEGRERDADALAVLDEAGRKGRLRVGTTADGGLALEPAGDDVWAALAELLAVAQQAMREGTWERLKVCASDDCRWAFYDSSKNRSGAWCSMKVCGNRAKVREHRARQRGEEPAHPHPTPAARG